MPEARYVVFNRDGWRISVNGTQSSVFGSKDEAVGIANRIAWYRSQSGDVVELLVERPDTVLELVWKSSDRRPLH